MQRAASSRSLSGPCTLPQQVAALNRASRPSTRGVPTVCRGLSATAPGLLPSLCPAKFVPRGPANQTLFSSQGRAGQLPSSNVPSSSRTWSSSARREPVVSNKDGELVVEYGAERAALRAAERAAERVTERGVLRVGRKASSRMLMRVLRGLGVGLPALGALFCFYLTRVDYRSLKDAFACGNIPGALAFLLALACDAVDMVMHLVITMAMLHQYFGVGLAVAHRTLYLVEGSGLGIALVGTFAAILGEFLALVSDETRRAELLASKVQPRRVAYGRAAVAEADEVRGRQEERKWDTPTSWLTAW